MEIGALVILAVIALGILFVESTKTGSKFAEWGLKNLVGININELKD